MGDARTMSHRWQKQLTWWTDGKQGLETESFSFRKWTFTLKVNRPFPTFGLHYSSLDAVYPRQRLRLHFQLWRHGCFQHDQKDQNRVGGFPGLRLQLRSFVTAPSAGRRSWLHWTCSIMEGCGDSCDAAILKFKTHLNRGSEGNMPTQTVLKIK